MSVLNWHLIEGIWYEIAVNSIDKCSSKKQVICVNTGADCRCHIHNAYSSLHNLSDRSLCSECTYLERQKYLTRFLRQSQHLINQTSVYQFYDSMQTCRCHIVPIDIYSSHQLRKFTHDISFEEMIRIIYIDLLSLINKLTTYLHSHIFHFEIHFQLIYNHAGIYFPCGEF